MKKILQYSLYALMACGFVEVNAADIPQPGSQCAASSEQAASAQRLAEIKASVPSVVCAYDALLKHSADDAAYSTLYNFIMKVKDCSKKETFGVESEFVKILRDVSAFENQRMSELGRIVPRGSKEHDALIRSSRTQWGGLPERSIKEWMDLSRASWMVPHLVGQLAHGEDCEILTENDGYRAYLNITSILRSQGKEMSEIFPRANCCFNLEARHSFESDLAYTRQIDELNTLYRDGASKRIMISVDGEASAKSLSERLNLPEKTVVERVTIEGTEDHLVPVTNALLQAIRNIGVAPNVEYVWVKHARLKDGAAFCDFLKDYGVRVITFEHVDSSLVQRGADNIGELLSQTGIESFSDECPAISDADRVANARFWATRLPTSIEELFVDLDDCLYGDEENEEILRIFRTVLKYYPHMRIFRSAPDGETFDQSEPNGVQFDLETLAYMALHPSFENDCFTKEKSLKQVISGTGVTTEAGALANVLMAFSKYRKILNDPYDHVKSLMDILRAVQDLYARLSPADACSLVEATDQFRERVEDEYDDFAALDKDELNNAFRQLVQQQYDSMVESLKSRLQQLSI